MHYHVVRRYEDATRHTSPRKETRDDAMHELQQQVKVERACGNTARKVRNRATYELLTVDGMPFRLFVDPCHDPRCTA